MNGPTGEPNGRDYLGQLRQLADTLGPSLAPSSGQDLLTALVRTARAMFGAQACSLAVLSPDASELVFTTVSGEGQDAVTGLRIPAAAGVAGWVVMSGQAVAVSEPQRDPRFAADVAASTGYVPTSILAAPVGTDRQTIGVMEVLDRDAERPGAGGDLELLGLFASQAALAIEATRVFEHFGAALLLAAADAVQNRAGMGAAEGGEPDGGAGGELGLGLADALRNAAAGQDLDLGHQLQLAGLVAELGSLGSADQQLAVGILSEVTAYVRRRDRRPR